MALTFSFSRHSLGQWPKFSTAFSSGQGVVWSAAKLTRKGGQPCAVGVTNGHIIGSFPSSVFQDIPGHTPDFWSASAATICTAFCHETAKHCPVDGWWSRHRGCRLLWEWQYQVRKLSVTLKKKKNISLLLEKIKIKFKNGHLQIEETSLNKIYFSSSPFRWRPSEWDLMMLIAFLGPQTLIAWQRKAWNWPNTLLQLHFAPPAEQLSSLADIPSDQVCLAKPSSI